MTLARVALFFCLMFGAKAALAQAYCVIKAGAILRKEPNIKSEKSWQVPKAMPLIGTGKRLGSWIEVKDVDAQAHWVAASDVTTKQNCLVVRVKNSRLRSGPGAGFQASTMGVADRYHAYLDLGGEEGWTQVQDEDGEKGWLNLDHAWKANKKSRVSFEGS